MSPRSAAVGLGAETGSEPVLHKSSAPKEALGSGTSLSRQIITTHCGLGFHLKEILVQIFVFNLDQVFISEGTPLNIIRVEGSSFGAETGNAMRLDGSGA